MKDRTIGDAWTLLETKKQKKRNQRKKEINDRLIKDRIIRDIRNFFEKEDDYYKPKRVSNLRNNNHIEYESNCDKNKNYHQMNNKTKLNIT